MNDIISNYGFKFQNTYAKLSPIMYSQINPVSVRNPELIIINEILSKEIGLDFSQEDSKNLSNIFAGNTHPEGSYFISQAYAGHQFGNFTVLGDGRATLMGEHLTPNNKLIDIQLKGSGRTPYSRGGDGRAALGPMLREYIISEAMYALRIPTTRGLAVVKTGEEVMRETLMQGAILTRVASSHIRIGTFQYLAMNGEKNKILELINYSINRHYKGIINEDDKISIFLELVMNNQINLIINWMRVGFIHGVMNTDNMTISGETIDYGPCAFMNEYNPDTVFSSIDHNGRYSFINQSTIAQWNLARLAETLIPLISNDEKKGLKKASDIINNFQTVYKKKWLKMMKCKIGLFNSDDADKKLIVDLLELMKVNKADFTNTFNYLSGISKINCEKYNTFGFKEWINKWHKRLDCNNKLSKTSLDLMKINNPIIIPRNHTIEEALTEACENDNFKPFKKFLKILNNPYVLDNDSLEFQHPPNTNDEKYRTFCGT